MENNLEFCDGDLVEFKSSGSSDDSRNIEYGTETHVGDSILMISVRFPFN